MIDTLESEMQRLEIFARPEATNITAGLSDSSPAYESAIAALQDQIKTAMTKRKDKMFSVGNRDITAAGAPYVWREMGRDVGHGPDGSYVVRAIPRSKRQTTLTVEVYQLDGYYAVAGLQLDEKGNPLYFLLPPKGDDPFVTGVLDLKASGHVPVINESAARAALFLKDVAAGLVL